MIPILYYLLKVVFCSAILYSYYWLVLRDKQFHQYNRFYLLGISVFSWILPLLKIGVVKEQVNIQPSVVRFANVIADNNSSLEQVAIEKSAQFNWDGLIILSAICITVLFILKLAKSLLSIKELIRKYPKKNISGLNLILTDVKNAPFSFFKYIFWNTAIDLKSEVGKKILAHEIVHVKQNHSFDKLVIELQLLLGWFNPVIWNIRKELHLIHEFIADQHSIQNNDTSELATLLLASVYPNQQHLLTNPYFFSPIKRRIHMFAEKSNTKFSYLRRVAILPLIFSLIVLLAFRNTNSLSRPVVHLNKQFTVIIDAGHGGIDEGASIEEKFEKQFSLEIATKIKSLNNNPNINLILTRESDKMISVSARAKTANEKKADLFISIHVNSSENKNLRGTSYYIPAKKNIFVKESVGLANNLLATNKTIIIGNNITTRNKGIWVIENVNMPAVLIECGYITNIDDLEKLKFNNVEIANNILSGIESYLANKGKDNNWIQDKSDTSINSSIEATKILPPPPPVAKPTYYVDGVKITEAEMKKISPNDIQSVNVWKGEKAINKYPEDGKNGVVEVVTKKVISGIKIAEKNISQPNELDKVVVVSYKDGKNVVVVGKPLFTAVKIPPVFSKVQNGWAKYLERALDRDLPKRRGAPGGQYAVKVYFEIDQDGKVINVKALNDPGYGTAEEAMRIFESAPRWTPAIQNGVNVKYAQTQEVVFVVVDK